MACYRYLILVSLFITSCAQVGTISGGEVDTGAPKPISSKVVPPNESVNFNSKEIKIPFNEFIRLNKPSENIIMVPPHAKVNAKVSGKTLYLDWEEELNPNTTYAIYLNNAIQDITESNDTLIQYVFSTGDNIDSLTYSVKVVDAWTNQPVNKCFVGLYNPINKEIVSFSNTSKSGNATLRYLPANNYDVAIFMDENNDLEFQPHEKVAFPEASTFALSESTTDSVPLRLYKPRLKPNIRTAQFTRPGKLLIGSNYSLESAAVFIDGSKINQEKIKSITKDSLAVFFDATEVSNIELIVNSDNINDTTKIRVNNSPHHLTTVLKSTNSNNQYSPSESVSFQSSDFINDIDTSLIEIINPEDSMRLNGFNIEFKKDQCLLDFDKSKFSKLLITFKKDAVQCTHGNNNEQTFNHELLPERKFGNVSLNLESFTTPIVLQLIKSGKVIRQENIESPNNAINLVELRPGDYTVKIIQDDNNNKKWDVGDFELKIQPESIYYFSTPITVRANWDVEVVLEKY